MILLYGASGHGKVVAEILELHNQVIEGFIDDNSSLTTLLIYPVYQPNKLIELTDCKLIVSIGNNRIRKNIVEKLNAKYLNACHPSSSISVRSKIEEGTVIMAGVSVNSSCKIGKHVIINTNASIDHDCTLDDYVHISPNAALAGNVHVGEGAHIGIGASVIQGVKIGKWCTIGAGAVIINDVPDGCTVVGNPGRIIKTTMGS